MGVSIRAVNDADLEAVYDICLRTGNAGNDASSLYRDPTLLGSIYVGPYVMLPEGRGFVATDDRGVGGYVLGTLDTRSFEEACEARWWPALRARHADPGPSPSTPDDQLRVLLHRPATAPDEIVEGHRAHLHIDLDPRLQGIGVGRRLIDRLLAWMVEEGATGVHLGVDRNNERAVGFYRHLGFVTVLDVGDALYLGRALP
ncbi:MAG TPA: GNAT family N-acetyltransferase [Desertimonas sp.]|nr:GNAT family N-acetyltransferase [Desertimonas sp.]